MDCGATSGGPPARSPHRHSAWLAQCLGSTPASPLTEEDVAAVLAAATVERAPVDSVLFRRGEPAVDVFVVETGRVALTRPAASRSALLQIARPGDVVGDVGLFLGQLARVEAVVIADAELLRIPGREVLRLVSTRPRLAVRWMVSMASRLADSQDRLEELLAGPLDLQLAVLLDHAADDGGTVAASQDLLARLLGARRTSVTRSLAGLERRGLIEKRYGQIDVVDRARLAALRR